MKKYLLIVFICLFTLTGCSEKTPPITMTIKEGTLTPTSAVIIIKENKPKHYTYGEWFRIDYKKDDKWEKLEPITDDIWFYMIGYDIDDNNELEMETNWEWLYGTLSPGEYRLVKRLQDNTEIYTEFKIT